jgi:hypothetical protein
MIKIWNELGNVKPHYYLMCEDRARQLNHINHRNLVQSILIYVQGHPLL